VFSCAKVRQASTRSGDSSHGQANEANHHTARKNRARARPGSGSSAQRETLCLVIGSGVEGLELTGAFCLIKRKQVYIQCISVRPLFQGLFFPFITNFDLNHKRF